MTTLTDIASKLTPNNPAIHELAQQADSLLLDIQNQRGHNGKNGSWQLTGARLTGGHSPTLMAYLDIHNLSDSAIHQLAKRYPRYDARSSKPDELLMFECRNGNSALAIWTHLIDDLDTAGAAA